MLNKFMMQEIIDLKLQGYTVAGIRDYYEAQGVKPPSMPTIRKYYGMDVLPGDPGEKLEKPKVFDVEPFRSEIIKVLERNRDNKSLCMAFTSWLADQEEQTDTSGYILHAGGSPG